MKKLLLPLLLLFTSLLLSQSKVDSLQMEYRKASGDTVKIKILNGLFQEYRYDSLSKAREMAIKAIELSQQTKQTNLLVDSYNQYADFLISQSSFDSAVVEYNKGLLLAEKIGFKDGRIESLIGLGNGYALQQDHKKALAYYEESVRDAENRNDKNVVAKTYNNIARVYVKTNDYTKAMKFYTMSSNAHLELGNIEDYAKTLANIGLVLRMLENYDSAEDYLVKSDSLFKELDFQPGRVFVLQNLAVIYKNTKRLDEAIQINNEALNNYERMGNRAMVAEVHYNMGNIYWEKEEFQNSVDNYQKALDIAIKIPDSASMAYYYKALGDGYYQLKDNERSKSYFLQAIKTGTPINLDLILMGAQSSLSEIYGEEGNFKKAYESVNDYARLKDSLYTKEKRELASEIEAKYQNEQKVEEIKLLSTEKDLQALQLEKRVNERNVLITFAFIILFIAGLLFNQFRIKQRANKKLQELDRLKSIFFANISHEFRTPLTLISGPIEHLEQNPDEKLSMQNIKMIRRNANRVLKMVNQLLDLSKIDQGNLKLECTEGDIYKCLRAAASSFNSHAAQRSMDYKVQIPKGLLWSSFDRDKLENILYNLIGNAFKFSPNGALISFKASFDENRLQIVVSDSGKGIPEEKLPFIFDRFYQVDNGNTREQGGSGIGLSLSKDLVGLMDGTITVSSKVGQGTLFTVHLPLQEIKTRQKRPIDNVPQMGKSLVKRPFTLLSTDKRNLPTILLIEDNADMRHFIKEHLVKFYKVKEAINGEAGLQKAKEDSPDLIITDLMMPKMDGIELCTKLKTDVHTSHIPLIMLTAKAGMENKIEGLETGADDYLTKPFDGKELLVRTKNLIEQRQKLREFYGNKEIQLDPRKITTTSIDQKFLEQVLELLEANFSDSEFGVPQMQDDLAMSKTQLHRKLKALTNEAPGELLRNFRLKRAAQLLSQKADSVTQIAYKVGFNNLSYFAKCFKELYGVAPSTY